MPIAGDGPCFSLLVATPWYALAAQAHAWPFWVVFSVSAIWSVTPPCCTATPGLGTSYLALVPAAACSLVDSIGPCAVASSANWRLGWWRKQPRSFPVRPRSAWSGFLVGVLLFLLRRPATNWLATSCRSVPAGSAADQPVLIPPARVTAKGQWA